MNHDVPSSESHRGQSRRSFLTTSAALAGAAVALGAGASGARAEAVRTRPSVKPGRVSPPRDGEPIRLAIIGTGGMGTGHAQVLARFASEGKADLQIVALADVCDSRLEHCRAKVVETLGDGVEIQTTRDYKEVLASDDVHGVVIASPEHWHAQHAIDAIIAGKDVYCEKPMTLSLDQAMDLRRIVLDHPDRVFQVGTQMMMLPKYRSARQAIKDGRIGKPVWSQTSYCRNSMDGEWLYYEIDPQWKPGVNLDWDAWLGYLGPRPWDPEVYARWRRYRDFSTGIIGDLLVHVMTPLMYALDLGWPTRVTATGGHYVDKAMENHDQVNLTLQLEGEHTMIVAGSTANEVGLETMIRGHEANIYLNDRHCVIRPERLFVDDIDPDTIHSPDIGNDQDALRMNWLECMRSRRPAESGIDLATKVMVAVDLASRSMWDGHAYAFDPGSMRAKRA